MMRSKSSGNNKTQATKEKGLLVSRFLSALPYADSVKDYYLTTKQSNEVMRIGLNFAESCVSTVSSPFVKRYTPLDNYAASQLDKLEKFYQSHSISSAAGAVAYPIGFTLGLAGYTRDQVNHIAKPAIEKTYDLADMLVDNLMPPESDETLGEEYAKLTPLQRKNPMRRIKNRANFQSAAFLPINAWNLSKDFLFSSMYISLGFSSMLVGRLLQSVSSSLNSMNIKIGFEMLMNPRETVSTGELSRIYQAMGYNGAQHVIEVLDVAIENSYALSRHLERRNLPHNATVPAYIGRKLKAVQRRLAKMARIELHKEDKEVPLKRKASSLSPRETKVKKEESHQTSKRKVQTERFPSMMLGENQFDLRKTEIEANRMPTILYGDDEPRGFKPLKEKVEESVAVIETETETETETPKDVDKFGFTLVKPKHHGHLLPLAVAQRLAFEMHHPKVINIPHTPTNSPATEMLNNPYVAVANAQQMSEPEEAIEVVREDVVSVNENSVESSEEEEEEKVEEKQVELEKVEEKQVEKVEEKQVELEKVEELKPERKEDVKEMSEDEKQEREAIEREIQEREMAAIEKEKEDYERQEQERVAAEEEEKSWEAPKHPIHVHVEEKTEEPAAPEVIPAAENNPFAKLAELEEANAMDMGMPSM